MKIWQKIGVLALCALSFIYSFPGSVLILRHHKFITRYPFYLNPIFSLFGSKCAILGTQQLRQCCADIFRGFFALRLAQHLRKYVGVFCATYTQNLRNFISAQYLRTCCAKYIFCCARACVSRRTQRGGLENPRLRCVCAASYQERVFHSLLIMVFIIGLGSARYNIKSCSFSGKKTRVMVFNKN